MRRTVRLDEEPWRIIYEIAAYCGIETGRVVSLTQALKAALFLLKDQGWFRANKQLILAKVQEISKEGEDDVQTDSRGPHTAVLGDPAVRAG